MFNLIPTTLPCISSINVFMWENIQYFQKCIKFFYKIFNIKDRSVNLFTRTSALTTELLLFKSFDFKCKTYRIRWKSKYYAGTLPLPVRSSSFGRVCHKTSLYTSQESHLTQGITTVACAEVNRYMRRISPNDIYGLRDRGRRMPFRHLV